MRIECLRESLEKAVYLADKVSGKNLSLPVLRCVLLKTNGKSKLILRATNLDLGIEIDIKAKVEDEGVAAIPSDILFGFLSNSLDTKNIKLVSEGKNVKLSTTRNSTTIKTLPHEDFPSIPKISGENSFKIKAENFIEGLKSVWFSASNSSMKPELSSVYIYSDGGKMVFVSTDSFRLSEKKIMMNKAKQFDPILVPYRNVGEIIRVLEETGGEVDIRFGENQVALMSDDIYLTSRTIDGVFPDYKQIIPKETKTQAVLLKHDILSVLKVSNIFSDKFNQTTFKIKPSKKTFVIESKNTEIGENAGKIDAALEGDDIEIGFNYKYVMDCFGSINSDSANLSLAGEGRPMTIKGVSDSSFTYIVMPMNR